jgi:hypothetical protein
MKLIPSNSLAKGWLEACEHLLLADNWVDTTVIICVNEPTRVSREDRAIAEKLDEFLNAHNKFSNHTVAETIFPGYEYIHRGVDGVYTTYPEEIYPRLKEHSDFRRWGTYAHRLLRRVDKNGKTYNPLEACIKKMLQKKPVRAAYELGFGFDLATHDDDLDRGARLGGPCLSHLSFKLIDSKVHLTAIYRSHYYVQRAYGNLLGLARLQSFVADRVGMTSGPLVCHSTLAQLEHDDEWSKSQVRSLVSDCALLAREDSASYARTPANQTTLPFSVTID